MNAFSLEEAPKSPPWDFAPPPTGPEDYGFAEQLPANDISLPIVTASSLAGKPIPARPWLVPDMSRIER
jgi:hypothetical protein